MLSGPPDRAIASRVVGGRPYENMAWLKADTTLPAILLEQRWAPTCRGQYDVPRNLMQSRLYCLYRWWFAGDVVGEFSSGSSLEIRAREVMGLPTELALRPTRTIAQRGRPHHTSQYEPEIEARYMLRRLTPRAVPCQVYRTGRQWSMK